jgi:hypothetical protein
MNFFTVRIGEFRPKKEVDYDNRGVGGRPILFVKDQNDPEGPLQLLI